MGLRLFSIIANQETSYGVYAESSHRGSGFGGGVFEHGCILLKLPQKAGLREDLRHSVRRECGLLGRLTGHDRLWFVSRSMPQPSQGDMSKQPYLVIIVFVLTGRTLIAADIFDCNYL